MTQTPATDVADESSDAAQLEGLWSIAVRRARYILAIIICGIIYYYLAWPLLNPPPEYTGVSVLAWGQHSVSLAFLGVAALVGFCTLLSMLITYPDAPHTAMFCSLLGLGIISIRGGSMHMLLQFAERHLAGRGLYDQLAWECLFWLGIVLVAEFVTRVAWGIVFRQSAWLTRLGAEPPHLAKVAPAPWMVAPGDAPPREGLAWMADLGAFGITLGLGTVLLVITLQSQAKGQVLFGCFVSFLLAAMAANGVFPKAQVTAIWLAVPVAAAIGYLRAATTYVSPAAGLADVYPGHAFVNMARALPIDYFLAGVPGAIVGVHATIGLRIHNLLATEAAEEAA